MTRVRMTKWRTLALATSGFGLSFLLWFSFSPFTGAIGEEFGLSLAELGVLASAAMWLAPPGRILTGWLTDRFGATRVFAVVLAFVGVFSIVSGLVTSYWAFFLSRLIVAVSGVTFVVGIQHVSQWFPEEQLGTAEGIYGLGNAGAAAGALVLPRAFGSDWRTAFIVTGAASIAMAAVYYLLGEDAATEARAEAAREGSSPRQWAHVATRYGVIALALAYVLSFGVELSMNGWLPTYFREAFGADLVLASTFASAFALAVGLCRPVGGLVSDRLVRAKRDILPLFPGRYREQWTFVCMCCVLAALCVLTAAGRTGDAALTVAATFLVGMTCGWTSGAVFAQVPAMFPDNSGTAAGIVGGIGTVGGIGFPLAFSYAASGGDIHGGYALVAVVAAPIVLLNAYVYRPELARRAHAVGLLDVRGDADPDE